MIVHAEPHPFAGRNVMITSGTFVGARFQVEDWWDRIAGRSWKDCDGNPACLDYAWRSTADGAPLLCDEVVYGKIGGLGKLIHVCNLPDTPESEGEPA